VGCSYVNTVVRSHAERSTCLGKETCVRSVVLPKNQDRQLDRPLNKPGKHLGILESSQLLHP